MMDGRLMNDGREAVDGWMDGWMDRHGWIKLN